MSNEYLYIKIDRNSMVHKNKVLLKDVAKLYSTNTKMVNVLETQVILKIKDNKESKHVFSILKIIEMIHSIYPDVQIENLGEIDFVIQYKPLKKDKKKKMLDNLKLLFVSFVIFFGAAFAIMTFNTDVSVKDVFKITYELVLGSEDSGRKILEICYSIGIPIGIIGFYNHFSKAKLSNDPTPLKIEMRLYEEDLDKTLIENASREDKMIDVD